jgi:hypothetical protein
VGKGLERIDKMKQGDKSTAASLLWCRIISGSQLASLPTEKGRRLKEFDGEDMADCETLDEEFVKK